MRGRLRQQGIMSQVQGRMVQARGHMRKPLMCDLLRFHPVIDLSSI